MDKELNQYKAKRNFEESTEPTGTKDSKQKHGKMRYVIQQHDASTMHYDFRIEVDGVLKSWAVPKGPSTDPNVKRLAIAVEDHPLDYADFEGKIPDGNYGAGPVIVWDEGEYENIRKASMTDALKEGQVEINLKGKKLQGAYALVQTKYQKENQWLLIKMKDEQADARRNPVSTQPESVKSGKKIDEI